jgi:hypothetical protein
MGTIQEVQEEDHSCRNENGPGAWQGASFEHVDALLVSGFGWDSISVCVEIVFI